MKGYVSYIKQESLIESQAYFWTLKFQMPPSFACITFASCSDSAMSYFSLFPAT